VNHPERQNKTNLFLQA